MPEFEARTAKEAITQGLQTLGLSQDDVTIEILEEGRSGVFGVGAKDARIRITPQQETALTTEQQPQPNNAVPTPAQETEASAAAPEAIAEGAEAILETTEGPEPETTPLGSEDEKVLAASTQFLSGLLQRMGLQASIEAGIEDSEDEKLYRLNITGEDLGILIGRRAETLDAFQYLTRLVVNQHTHRWYRVEVDVENYRRRRQQSLQRLAQTMADRAVSEGRTIILEPMSPRERRLVHLSLSDRDDVRTESIGEGESRKVTISPN